MAAPNIADLFGDSDEDNVSNLETENPRSNRHQDSEDARRDDTDDELQDFPTSQPPRQPLDFSDDDAEEFLQEVQERPVGPPQEISAALLPQPGINKLQLLQTSKFLGIQTLAMTAENLKKERVKDDLAADMGKTRYSYKNQMVLRWRERKLPNGESRVESNARFVRWSNGTTQLLLGDEVLDIAELDNTTSNQYVFVRHTHPVAFIQGQGQLCKKLHLRPASLSSKFHKQLTADAARKHTKANKVKATATVIDPYRAKIDQEKAEEDRIKSKENLLRKQDREMKKFSNKRPGSYLQRPRLSAGFLEGAEGFDAEESDEEGLTATERARVELQRRKPLDEEDEREAEEKLTRAQQSVVSWSKSPREERISERTVVKGLIVDDDDDEEDDDEGSGARKPAKKSRRATIFDDDGDDD